MDDLFEPLAEYYDLFDFGLEGDIEFYKGLAQRIGGPVLEVGCGTGRILLPLLSDGIEIVGLDSSESMLAVLKRKASVMGLSPTAYLLDMRDFKLDERFRLVFVPYRAFLHMLTIDDQLSALYSFLRHLEPGGTLAIDFFVPDLALIESGGRERGEIPEHSFVHPQTGNRVLFFAGEKFNPANQLIYGFFEFEERGADDNLIKTTRFDFTLRYFFRFEFQHLLERAGFRDIHLYGGFNYEDFTSESEQMVWLARRR